MRNTAATLSAKVCSAFFARMLAAVSHRARRGSVFLCALTYRLLIFFILTSSNVAASSAATLFALHHEVHAQRSFFVFTLSQNTLGKMRYQPEKATITIALKNTQPGITQKKLQFAAANVRALQVKAKTPHLLEIAISVKGPVKPSIRLVKMLNTKQVRLELDVISPAPLKKNIQMAYSAPTALYSAPASHLASLRLKNSAVDKMASLRQTAAYGRVQTPKAHSAGQGLADASLQNGEKPLTAQQQNSNTNDKIEDLLLLLSTLNAPNEQKKATKARPLLSPGSPLLPKKIGRPFIVVIDPGHGGKDSGAIGPHGTREKEVVLSIAKKLVLHINKEADMRAILTRNGDYFVPLRTRLVLARKGDADLFIAVHADAYFHTRARGVSVYALSQRGASSEAARWLAKKDNYSELDGVELDILQDRSPLLRSVLIDMAQTATIQDSLRLGNKVLASLKKMANLHHERVEQAQFVVLKSPDIPSILIETGFITNPLEERRLADPFYQQQLANEIFSGIKYYKQNLLG